MDSTAKVFITEHIPRIVYLFDISRRAFYAYFITEALEYGKCRTNISIAHVVRQRSHILPFLGIVQPVHILAVHLARRVMHAAHLSEHAIHRHTQSTIARVRELAYHPSTRHIYSVIVDAIRKLHLHIAVGHGRHHAIFQTLTSWHISHHIVALVHLHACASLHIDAAVFRAHHIAIGVKVEYALCLAHFVMQTGLRDAVQHHLYFATLRYHIVRCAKHGIQVIIRRSVSTFLPAIFHDAIIAQCRTVSLECLHAAVASYLRIGPCLRVGYARMRTATSEEIQVCSIQRPNFSIHHRHPQFIKLVVAPHIRIVGVRVHVLVLGHVDGAKSAYAPFRISSAVRIQDILHKPWISSVITANHLFRDYAVRASPLVALQLCIYGVEWRHGKRLKLLRHSPLPYAG